MGQNKKKVTNRFRANLYALTCLACVLWFGQSFSDFRTSGNLSDPSSIFLLVCVAIAVIYSGIEAIIYWRKPLNSGNAKSNKTDEQAVAEATGIHQSRNGENNTIKSGMQIPKENNHVDNN